MRVFLLNGVKLADAARIAAQAADPWASEVFCSFEDWFKEKWPGDSRMFAIEAVAVVRGDEHRRRRWLLCG